MVSQHAIKCLLLCTCVASAAPIWSEGLPDALSLLQTAASRQSPGVCKPQVECDMVLDTVELSNLPNEWANVNPSFTSPFDPSKPSEVRWSNVCMYKGRSLDLVLTLNSKYYTAKPAMTGSGGKFGRFNLKCGKGADTTFSFYEKGTYTPVTVDSFYFSFYDSDSWISKKNKHLQWEMATVTGYKSWYKGGVVSRIVASEKGNSLTFNSTIGGGVGDNPSDPMTLTELQASKSVTFLFEKTSKFNVFMGIFGPNTYSTRNFMFGGASNFVPECKTTTTTTTTPHCYQPRSCIWDFSQIRLDEFTMAASPPQMRVGSNCNISDVPYGIDLVATAVTPYVANRDDRNGFYGASNYFGLFNIKAGTSLTVEFKMVNSATSAPVKVDNIDFEVTDLDNGPQGQVESVELKGYDWEKTSPDTLLYREEVNGGVKYYGTVLGYWDDNPTSAAGSETKAKSVYAGYKSLSSFPVVFSATAGESGRNFYVRGKTIMGTECM